MAILTYTGRRNLFGDLCNNSSASVLTLADTLMNSSEKKLLVTKDYPFLWRQYTKTTTASTQVVNLPPYTNKPQSVYVTVGSYRYSPREVTTRTEWDKINQVSVVSDIPTAYFVYDGQILLFPTPASTGNVVTFNARRILKDLARPDYTTGSVTTVATTSGVTTITGTGTTWTSAMIGRWICIAEDDTANTGDGYWYEIATVPSTTTLTLVRTYGGTAISAATASYIIGEVSLLPEPHNQLPVFEALNIYFTSVDPDTSKATLYAAKVKDAKALMDMDHKSKVNVVLNRGIDESEITNPNLLISY